MKIFGTLFLVALAAAAQVVPGRFIVELSTTPPSKSASKAALRSQQARVRAMLQQRNVTVVDSVETVANALIVEASDAADLVSIPGVVRVTPDRLYKLYLDRAVGLQQVAEAWLQAGGTRRAGQGIKIGIIDTGIDHAHPAFQDSSLPPLEGFPKGTNEANLALTNNKVIVARTYDRSAGATARDVKGHGTSVAMVAAGVTNNGPRGAITGIAPGAYLGNYKVFPDSGTAAPSSGILRAIDDAVSDGMDVINLSLGVFPAPHLRDDPFSDAIERAMAAGTIVVVAAGNEGPDMNTIGSPGTAPAAITVGNAYSDRIFSASATLENALPYLSVASDSAGSRATVRGQLVDVNALDLTGLACNPLPAGSLTGRIALIARGECLFSDKLNNAQTAGASAALVYAREDEPEPFTMSTGAASLPASMIGHADGLDAKARLQNSPNLEAVLSFSSAAVTVNSARLGGSSSKGPSVDLGIKPDILGIGTAVYTASPNNAYTVANGTSLSSPMIAGAAALLKAARPGLTAKQYRSLLINNANMFPLSGTHAIQQTGSGLLSLNRALNSSLTVQPATISFGTASGTIDSMQAITVTNLGGAANQFSVQVIPSTSASNAAPELMTNTLTLEPGQSRTVPLRFQASNLQAQTYQGFIAVRGNSANSEVRVPYWLAVPSNTAVKISAIEPPTSGLSGSNQSFYVRVLDSSGLALAGQPRASVVSGGGESGTLESADSLYPGMYRVSLRLGDLPGDNIFELEAAGIRQRITIVGR